MTAYIEFCETENVFGSTGRIRKSVEIKSCGKNRRVSIAIKAATKKYPELTINRVLAFFKE